MSEKFYADFLDFVSIIVLACYLICLRGSNADFLDFWSAKCFFQLILAFRMTFGNIPTDFRYFLWQPLFFRGFMLQYLEFSLMYSIFREDLRFWGLVIRIFAGLLYFSRFFEFSLIYCTFRGFLNFCWFVALFAVAPFFEACSGGFEFSYTLSEACCLTLREILSFSRQPPLLRLFNVLCSGTFFAMSPFLRLFV